MNVSGSWFAHPTRIALQVGACVVWFACSTPKPPETPAEDRAPRETRRESDVGEAKEGVRTSDEGVRTSDAGGASQEADVAQRSEERRESRVTLAAQAPKECSPAGIGAKGARPLPVEMGTLLGGCALKPTLEPGPPMPAPNWKRVPWLDAFSDRERIRAEVRCNMGREPVVDPDQKLYVVLYDVLLSSEHYEPVFSVDDGRVVHVGIRVTRICQGVVPRDVLVSTVLEIPEPRRDVIVHRCPPRYPSCGPVP